MRRSLLSLLHQTLRGVKITVMDNNSSDNTEALVKELQQQYPHLHYHKVPEYGMNAVTARQMASAEYSMYFHDDDLLHPQYLEISLQLLNQHSNVDLICSRLTTFTDDAEVSFPDIQEMKYQLFPDSLSFISHVCIDYTMLIYPNIIYRTRNVQQRDVELDCAGKASDKPFVLSTLRGGKVIHMPNTKMFYYRIHPGQDTETCAAEPNPNPEQVINHLLFLKNRTAKKLWSRFCYHIASLEWVDFLYRFGRNDPRQIRAFYKQCYQAKAINFFSYKARKGAFRTTFQKLICRIHNKLKKRFKKQYVLSATLSPGNQS